MAKVVGEVAIDVTADIGPLVRQMKRGEGAMDGLRGAANKAARGLQSFGDRAERLGKTLSVVTGAMAAIGGGAFLLAKGTADSAKEIQNLSRVANTSTDEFQRMAAGARTVGIEQDKLSDILKDVNDRVGDFNATGGGPMADFFENIAPKVGITADAFKDLSGPQALQLYVDSLNKAGLSQADMTFYMEAMASDATALLPLLANNGAEMTRLGNAAAKAGGVMDATAIAAAGDFNTALNNLQTAFQGVRDRLAVSLMPALTSLMNSITDKVIPALHQVVTVVSGWTEAFAGLPMPVQEAAAAIGVALGVGGPILIGIGLVSKAIAFLISGMGPIGLFILAASALGTAWLKWGDDFKAGVGGAIDYVSDKFQDLKDFLQGIVETANAVATAVANALMPGVQRGPGGTISGNGAQPDLGAGFNEGQQIGNGLVSGLGQSITDNDAAIREYINQVPAIARDELGIKSPSRVFAEIGQFLGLGMAQGISDSTGLVAAAAANMGKVAVANTQEGVSGVLSSMGQLFQGSKKISAGIALANSWLAFTEVLKDPSFIGRPFARIAAAGAALASGLNAVRNIKSAQPGGTGGGAGRSAAPQVTETRTANINFYGGFQPTQETIGMIAGGLNDWLGDGGQLNIGRS